MLQEFFDMFLAPAVIAAIIESDNTV